MQSNEFMFDMLHPKCSGYRDWWMFNGFLVWCRSPFQHARWSLKDRIVWHVVPLHFENSSFLALPTFFAKWCSPSSCSASLSPSFVLEPPACNGALDHTLNLRLHVFQSFCQFLQYYMQSYVTLRLLLLYSTYLRLVWTWTPTYIQFL